MINALTKQELTDGEIRSVTRLAEEQVAIERTIASLQNQLEMAGDKLSLLSDKLIPDRMLELGLSDFTLSDGSSVMIKKFYNAKIPEERAGEAFNWLRANGHGDLIKNSLSLSFMKGEDDLCREVAQMLIAKGLAPEQKTGVHPMTLKSFVKEQIESGQDLPTDLLGVFVGNKAKIVAPKTKK
jgi:hypothetical protein